MQQRERIDIPVGYRRQDTTYLVYSTESNFNLLKAVDLLSKQEATYSLHVFGHLFFYLSTKNALN